MASILLVEDEVVLQKLFHDPLTKAGHKVSVAEDGQKALESIKKSEPDLIILDLLLPVMDGLKFLRIYNLEKHHKAKIMVLTNYYTDDIQQKVLKLGVEHFYLKADYTPSQLIDLVEGLLTEKS
jgi:CheY-like chemotaxis protein